MQAAKPKTLLLATMLLTGIAPLAAHTRTTENSRLGLDAFKTSLHQEIELDRSLKAIGIDAELRQNRIGPRCTGKDRDEETGLDYFGARYMSAAQGRWTSPDRINVTNQRLVMPSNTLNKYVYAANSPLKYIDPNGEYVAVEVKTGGAARSSPQVAKDSAMETQGARLAW